MALECPCWVEYCFQILQETLLLGFWSNETEEEAPLTVCLLSDPTASGRPSRVERCLLLEQQEQLILSSPLIMPGREGWVGSWWWSESTGSGGGPFHCLIPVPLSCDPHCGLLCSALRLVDTIIMLTFQSRKLKFRERDV